jgi:hypothetical protein
VCVCVCVCAEHYTHTESAHTLLRGGMNG